MILQILFVGKHYFPGLSTNSMELFYNQLWIIRNWCPWTIFRHVKDLIKLDVYLFFLKSVHRNKNISHQPLRSKACDGNSTKLVSSLAKSISANYLRAVFNSYWYRGNNWHLWTESESVCAASLKTNYMLYPSRDIPMPSIKAVAYDITDVRFIGNQNLYNDYK